MDRQEQQRHIGNLIGHKAFGLPMDADDQKCNEIAASVIRETHRIDCEELAVWLDSTVGMAVGPDIFVEWVAGLAALREGRLPGEPLEGENVTHNEAL